ncbi:hypothetical protein ACFQY7_19870 [Actinomadura luteofluorescens]|uniref:hypothetical protein n=1 Tax=Actinomadura luteofluorescens TaxID=46163 RepID=UPI003637E616
MDIDRLIENLRVEHRARAREHWRRHRGASRHLPARPVQVVQQAGQQLRRAAGSAVAAAERGAGETETRVSRPERDEGPSSGDEDGPSCGAEPRCGGQRKVGSSTSTPRVLSAT